MIGDFLPTAISKVLVCTHCGSLVGEDFTDEHFKADLLLAEQSSAILAIEKTLGLLPQGEKHETVAERLEHIELVQHNQAKHHHEYFGRQGDALTSGMKIKL